MTDRAKKIEAALRSLLSDVEAMYRGDTCGDGEEYFGRFWHANTLGDDVGYDVGAEDGVEVSWPNLAISMRHARDVLGD